MQVGVPVQGIPGSPVRPPYMVRPGGPPLPGYGPRPPGQPMQSGMQSGMPVGVIGQPRPVGVVGGPQMVALPHRQPQQQLQQGGPPQVQMQQSPHMSPGMAPSMAPGMSPGMKRPMPPGMGVPPMQQQPPGGPHGAPMQQQQQQQQQQQGPMGGGGSGGKSAKKKKKLADKILPQKVRELVPESQAYMDLLSFERKLDSTIMRKRLDIQEALKRPMKQKRKLRIFISNTAFPAKEEGSETGEGGGGGPPQPGSNTASWELRVEGRLIDEDKKVEAGKSKRKFSSFFKSLVIELDKDLYGPDNHLVEWHRTPTTQETDGFQVKRPGDKNVRCTILLLLDYQPLQFKLDQVR
jgi:SWI/SNF-related matrix-associated actin-dependent regulator of chromatin subfamily D